jgi:hypothetical protein
MNETQSSLPSETSRSKDVAEVQGESTSPPNTIGVYEQPERRMGLSVMAIGMIAILIAAIILIVLIFQFII